jgi:hypothetical protein
MPEPTFSMTADDDLPRTIRREREARDREAREREAREREARERQASARPEPVVHREAEMQMLPLAAATVVDFDVPFAKLAMFFIKAVFAAIPALLVLLALLWVLGHTLQLFLPQLLKMKILIYMP